METKKQYEPHILELLNLPGFMAYYYQMLSEYAHEKKPSEKAWEATERAHKRFFNKTRYNSYYTFKSALSRYNKKKRKSKLL